MFDLKRPALIVFFGIVFLVACGVVIATSPRDGRDQPEREVVREAMERFVGPGGLEVIEFKAQGDDHNSVWFARVRYRPYDKKAKELANIDDAIRGYVRRHPKWQSERSIDRERAARIASAQFPAWWKSDTNSALWLPNISGFIASQANSADEEWNVMSFNR